MKSIISLYSKVIRSKKYKIDHTADIPTYIFLQGYQYHKLREVDFKIQCQIKISFKSRPIGTT